MSPRLPPEIFDYIVDLLHDKPETLRNCCLASKSWVPRARTHLFAEVAFRSLDDLKAWKQTFPDPVNSPACCTRSLIIGCAGVVPATVVEESSWVQGFSKVIRLSIVGTGPEFWSASRLSNLVCFLPLLEDLDVKGFVIDNDDTNFQPSTSPPLTGTLRLRFRRWIGSATRQLLDLPNGVRFRKLDFTWFHESGLQCASAALEACSDTIECVSIRCGSHGIPQAGSIDLSKARRLKEVVVHLGVLDDVWATLALKTLTPNHRDLHQISIHIPINSPLEPRLTMGFGGIDGWWGWADLDRFLVQLWELNAFHTRVVYVPAGEKEACECIGKLLPEMMKRGIVELVDKRELDESDV